MVWTINTLLLWLVTLWALHQWNISFLERHISKTFRFLKRFIAEIFHFLKRHICKTFHFLKLFILKRQISETFHVFNVTFLKHFKFWTLHQWNISFFWTLCFWNIVWTLDTLLLCLVTIAFHGKLFEVKKLAPKVLTIGNLNVSS